MTKDEIHVHGLRDGNRMIVPDVWLGSHVEYRTDADGYALSAVAYNQQMQLHTLTEARHAYFDKNSDGSWVAPDYRESVRSMPGSGEWFATWLCDGKKIIVCPERIFRHEKYDWVIEGGDVHHAELPREGWALEYDKLTGFPSRTSSKKQDAERVFGDDASYFLFNPNGVRAVRRIHYLLANGPFDVYADYGPDDRYSYLGGRSCRRSEQDATRLATPVYVMGQTEYEALVQKYHEMGELLKQIRVQE